MNYDCQMEIRSTLKWKWCNDFNDNIIIMKGLMGKRKNCPNYNWNHCANELLSVKTDKTNCYDFTLKC